MRTLVGIVADDLTGAADTGAAFLARGLSVVVIWPDQGIERESISVAADVIAVDMRSRAADAEYARQMTCEVTSGFRQTGVSTLSKKIDSPVAATASDSCFPQTTAIKQPVILAVVAPAFPGTGRTTVEGRQCVDGVPIARRAFVPALFEQAGISTRRADLACVRGAALESLFLECQHHQGIGAVVCDAETDEDLRAIARAGARLGPAIVWVGSGGLARAIAADVGATPRQIPPPTTRVSGPMLIVVGSRSEIARAQADAVEASGVRRVIVPVEALARGSVTAGQGLTHDDIAREIGAHLRAGEDVLVTLGGGSSDDVEDDPRLASRLSQLLRPLYASVVEA
jgi:4-hydroxythreonine-4-phosphate dehydrogenase